MQGVIWGFAMERWILVCGVVAIFLGLAVMGWHYQPKDSIPRACTSAEAQCDERHM